MEAALADEALAEEAPAEEAASAEEVAEEEGEAAADAEVVVAMETLKSRRESVMEFIEDSNQDVASPGVKLKSDDKLGRWKMNVLEKQKMEEEKMRKKQEANARADKKMKDMTARRQAMKNRAVTVTKYIKDHQNDDV